MPADPCGERFLDRMADDPTFEAGYRCGEQAMLGRVIDAGACPTCLKRLHLALLREGQAIRTYARAQGVELSPERPQETAWRHLLARDLGVEP